MVKSPVNAPAITIYRFKRTQTVTHSVIFVNGHFCCYSFENNAFLIPERTYVGSLFSSPKFHRNILQLVVSGHEGIEFHPANYSTQLRGCVSPVDNLTNDGGFTSTIACNRFYDYIGTYERYTVVVKSLS